MEAILNVTATLLTNNLYPCWCADGGGRHTENGASSTVSWTISISGCALKGATVLSCGILHDQSKVEVSSSGVSLYSDTRECLQCIHTCTCSIIWSSLLKLFPYFICCNHKFSLSLSLSLSLSIPLPLPLPLPLSPSLPPFPSLSSLPLSLFLLSVSSSFN